MSSGTSTDPEAALEAFKSNIHSRLKTIEEKKRIAGKSREDYIRLRDNILERIQEVDKEIADYDKQIESGHKAIRDLEDIYKREVISKSPSQTGAQVVQSTNNTDGDQEEEDPFTTEDGLPMMEICEELDEDENLITGSARPQRSQQLADFANGPLADIIAKQDAEAATTSGEEKPQNDAKAIEDKKPVGPELPPWMVEKKPNPYVSSNLQPKPRKMSKPPSTPAEIKEASEAPKSTPESIQTHFSSSGAGISSVEKPAPENANTDEKEVQEQNTPQNETPAAESPNFNIPSEEMIELELLAQDSESDFDPGEDFEYIEEDYNFSQDDDEDESEDEFGRTKGRGSFFPFLVQPSKKEPTETVETPQSDKPSKNTPTTPGKSAITKKATRESEALPSESKSVRFSESIEVKTFEKDPRDVHGNLHGSASALQNLFQQHMSSIAPESPPWKLNDPGLTSIPYNGPPRSAEQELLDLVYPDASDATGNMILKNVSPPTVQQSTPEVKQAEEEPQEPKPKVSRFKAARMKPSSSEDTAQRPSTASFPSSVSPIGSVIERDFAQNKTTNSSSFWNKSPTPLSNEIKERNPVSSSIQERAPPVTPKYQSSPKSTPTNAQRASQPQGQPSPPPTTHINSKPKVSRFKAQRSKVPPVTSTRIEELSSEETVSDTKETRSNPSSFSGIVSYPSTMTSGRQGNAPVPNSTIDRIANPEPVDDSSAFPRGIENLRPGLASGMKSMFSPELLAKADEYYQQSLLSEEDFIRAHLGDESNEKDAEIMAAEREAYEKEQKEKLEKQHAYKTRPLMENTLVERESAPQITGRGMGFVPDEYLTSNHDDDEGGANDFDEDYEVNKAEIAREYQKIRQSLIYQTGGYGQSLEELEMEPVDDGSVKKMSRFKAARLSSRRM